MILKFNIFGIKTSVLLAAEVHAKVGLVGLDLKKLKIFI